MNFAGIDYSMSCPSITVGISKDYSKTKTFFYCAEERKTKKFAGKFGTNIFGLTMGPYETQEERFDLISDWAMAILLKFKVTDVCLEGYSMGSKGLVFNIAENCGLLKHKMWKAGIKIHLPSPKTVKKFFTGKGNANKIEMYEAFYEITKVDLTKIINTTPDKNPISDIVDSYAMLCYGIDEAFNVS